MSISYDLATSVRLQSEKARLHNSQPKASCKMRIFLRQLLINTTMSSLSLRIFTTILPNTPNCSKRVQRLVAGNLTKWMWGTTCFLKIKTLKFSIPNLSSELKCRRVFQYKMTIASMMMLQQCLSSKNRNKMLVNEPWQRHAMHHTGLCWFCLDPGFLDLRRTCWSATEEVLWNLKSVLYTFADLLNSLICLRCETKFGALIAVSDKHVTLQFL